MVTTEVERNTMQGQPPPEMMDDQHREQDDDRHDEADDPKLLEELDGAGVVLAERRANRGDDATIEQRANGGSSTNVGSPILAAPMMNEPYVRTIGVSRAMNTPNAPRWRSQSSIGRRAPVQPDVAPDASDGRRADTVANDVGHRREDQATSRGRDDSQDEIDV